MDDSFLPATVLHLIADRSLKARIPHLFSLVLIIAAVMMKLLGMPYPAPVLVFWYFYIWFLYGSLIVRRYVRRADAA